MTNPENLIMSIDPGTSGLGIATFFDRKLAHAAYVKGVGGQPHPLLEVVDGFEAYIKELAPGKKGIDLLIIEIPQIYSTKQQKGRQEDLIKLAIAVGTILRAARHYVKNAMPVLPAHWKGQAQKHITERRVRKRLKPSELAAVDLPTAAGLHHNCWDAIGIGLWRLHRMALKA